MSKNVIEILVKTISKQAVDELNKLEKALGKTKTSGSMLTDLKTKFKDFDSALSGASGSKAMISAWKGVAGAAGVVGTALVAAGATAKKLADDYMAYAFQVEDFGRIIGATPEQASKLIQVADDVRLSTESMTAAMRGAITKGYAPTVENLGRLSDAYLAIQDPIERSKFLIDTFGRAGLEMGKLMEVGSQKIKEMGDSIEGTGLLMTKEGIDKATEYYQAIDQLGDSWTALKTTLGGEVIPVITATANALNYLLQTGLGATAGELALVDAFMKGNITIPEFVKLVGQANTAQITATDVTQILSDKVSVLADKYTGTGYAEVEYIRATQMANNVIQKQTEDLSLLGHAASDAKGKVGTLASGINDLKDKSVTVTVNVEQQGYIENWLRGLLQYRINQTEAARLTGQAGAAGATGGAGGTGATTNNNPLRMPPTVNNPRTEKPWTPAELDTWRRNHPNAGGQFGLDLVVPPGFTRDSFGIGASSGERVIVLTQAQQRARDLQTPGKFGNHIMVAATNPSRQLASAGQTVTVYGGLNLYGIENQKSLLDELSELLM